MITWFAKNDVAANLLMIMIVALGVFSLYKLIPVEVFPVLEKDEIKISMSLKGATPEDIEEGLTIRIEEAIADLEGIKNIESKSSEGKSSVSIELDESYDVNKLLADVKSRVDAVNTFPQEADRAIIEQTVRKHEVIVMTLSSIYGEKETREYAQNLRDNLLQVEGISKIELSGIRDYEIKIDISQDILLEYDITLQEVSQAIKSSSVDLSAGNLKTSSGDILLRLKGQAYNKSDFEKIIIKQNINGSITRLEDIASINDGFEQTPIRSRFNGKNSVFLDVYRIGKQSAIDVASKVKDFIKKEEVFLPKGYELSYWDDDSQKVKNRLSILLKSALQGSVLIIILLTLFLRPAIALWVFIGIPISFAGAFFLMPLLGATLNVLSLFAFILVLGIVVDDAIVTGENIYTHLKRSESGEVAAIQGTKEIATPVTFGVLTTMAAFIPLAFIEGQRSNLFTQIPYVVIPVLLFSLIESKLILPAHLKHIKLRHEKNKTSKLEKLQEKFADGFESFILRYYKPLLALCLKNKLSTVLVFVSTLIILSSLLIGGWTKFIFFPRIPSETIRVSLTMPTGTPFEVTNEHIKHITKQAQILKEKYKDEETGKSVIQNILTITGGRGGVSNKGNVRFEITPREERESDITSDKLAREWRILTGPIIGSEKIEFRSEWGRTSSPIDIQLKGNSLDTLKTIAIQIKEHLKEYETVFDISDSLSDGKEELKIELTQEGQLLGLSKNDIASQVRAAVYGIQVQNIQRGRDDVKVMLRFPKEERESLSNLKYLMIVSNEGHKIPLNNVAKLVSSKGPTTINRINRFRTINVTADVEKNNTNMFALQRELKIYLDELMSKYPNVNYSLEGENKEQEETFNSLYYALIFSFFSIYILLAIPFKSYIQPFIVMSVIPFGVIGAFIGHWILNMNLTVLSLMGMLALTGVVVNDSLVLVDYINKQYKKTNDLLESVLSAGAARFRPVMLTSLTTFIGLLPLLFEKSTGAQFLIPMATSLGFGILFATFTTLILVPVHFMMLDSFVKFLKNK